MHSKYGPYIITAIVAAILIILAIFINNITWNTYKVVIDPQQNIDTQLQNQRTNCLADQTQIAFEHPGAHCAVDNCHFEQVSHNNYKATLSCGRWW